MFVINDQVEEFRGQSHYLIAIFLYISYRNYHIIEKESCKMQALSINNCCRKELQLPMRVATACTPAPQRLSVNSSSKHNNTSSTNFVIRNYKNSGSMPTVYVTSSRQSSVDHDCEIMLSFNFKVMP